MATQLIQNEIEEFNLIIPHLLKMSQKKIWIDYDQEVDVLYVNYRKPQRATDSEMLTNGIIVRYCDEEIVGLTIIDASQRNGKIN
jgi:uncharacterized protein YuzE